MVLDGERIAGIDVLEENPAFIASRRHLISLHPAFARVLAGKQPETVTLRADKKHLSCSLYPVEGTEVMVVIEDVTFREELEQQSRASQDRFETAFHGNAAAMVIAHQSDLRIVDVNPRWLEMFGATREEVIGRTSVALGLISEADAQTRIAEHRAHTEGYDIELALRTRTGQKLTVIASARPIQLPEGRCTLTTLIDITGRKYAEEAFAAAFSASPAGMILVDSDSNTVISVNERLLEMTGFERTELVGHSVAEIELVRRPLRSELLAELTRTGRLRAVEMELARRDGGFLWTLGSTETITLNGAKHRLSVFTDITERKRIESRLMTQHEVGRHLAEAHDLDEAIPRVLEALCRGEDWSAGAMWLPYGDGEMQCRGVWQDGPSADLGAIARAVVPRNSVGVVGKVIATGEPEQAIVDGAQGPLSAAAFAAGIRTALAFPILRGDFVLGVVVLSARSEHPPMEGAERGLFDSVGRMLGLFVERTMAEASLRELNLELEERVDARTRELESSNRDLEAFSSSVSHDLRAPLRTIQGFSQVMLEDYGAILPDEAKTTLHRIHASGVRLRTLIDDLLSFSRVGRDRLNRMQVDLDAMVRSVVDELVAGRGIDPARLDVRIQPLGVCNADLTLLRAVWTNLVDNALKYARDRPRIEIEIGREKRGTEVAYYVRDNGVGFDMAHADRLFGVFQRLHPADEFEGTGVGLANVRRMIERHHGRVSATSEVGRGSRFEFTIGDA